MERTPRLSVSYLIRKLLANGEDVISAQHPWLWESDRWKELVFCLLTSVFNGDQEYLREITEQLGTLGLIDMESLSSLSRDSNIAIDDNPAADELVDFFMDKGFDRQLAIDAVVTISEAAFGIQKNFRGKVQQYLRLYGQLLINDLPKHFSFSRLDQSQTNEAFVYWMQNVLNLPMSIIDNDMRSFAQSHGITTTDLVDAADDMNINVSLLDDLIRNYMLTNEVTTTDHGRQ